MRKLPTGEPCAGEPPARFGGRGGREPFPTPIKRKYGTCAIFSLALNRSLRSGKTAIPHRAPALDVFLAIKPRIPLAQEFEQVPVLISQIQDHESLAWNVEHMNPHEVVEDPACGRVLNASAFLVREGNRRVLQRSADAVL